MMPSEGQNRRAISCADRLMPANGPTRLQRDDGSGEREEGDGHRQREDAQRVADDLQRQQHRPGHEERSRCGRRCAEGLAARDVLVGVPRGNEARDDAARRRTATATPPRRRAACAQRATRAQRQQRVVRGRLSSRDAGRAAQPDREHLHGHDHDGDGTDDGPRTPLDDRVRAVEHVRQRHRADRCGRQHGAVCRRSDRPEPASRASEPGGRLGATLGRDPCPVVVLHAPILARRVRDARRWPTRPGRRGTPRAMARETAPVDGYRSATYGDGFADVYDEWYGQSSDPEPPSPICWPGSPEEARVLELGVGTGRLAAATRRTRPDGVRCGHLRRDAEPACRSTTRTRARFSPLVPTCALRHSAPTCSGCAFVAYNTLFNLPDLDSTTSLSRLGGTLPRARRSFVVEAFVPRTDERVRAGCHGPRHRDRSCGDDRIATRPRRPDHHGTTHRDTRVGHSSTPVVPALSASRPDRRARRSWRASNSNERFDELAPRTVRRHQRHPRVRVPANVSPSARSSSGGGAAR